MRKIKFLSETRLLTLWVREQISIGCGDERDFSSLLVERDGLNEANRAAMAQQWNSSQSEPFSKVANRYGYCVSAILDDRDSWQHNRSLMFASDGEAGRHSRRLLDRSESTNHSANRPVVRAVILSIEKVTQQVPRWENEEEEDWNVNVRLHLHCFRRLNSVQVQRTHHANALLQYAHLCRWISHRHGSFGHKYTGRLWWDIPLPNAGKYLWSARKRAIDHEWRWTMVSMSFARLWTIARREVGWKMSERSV